MDQSARPKRGLSALLASTTQAPAPQAGTSAETPVLTNAEVPIIAIRPNPSQPRTNFDPEALAELARSIQARGLIQPLVARHLKPGEISGEIRYELIAGERRWRAAQLAGLSTVPLVVKHVFDEREILLLSLVENLQREDLNPIEEALSYDRLAKMFSLSHEQIAEGVGKNRATISNAIRILELPAVVQDAVRTRKLSMAHAKVLLAIPDARIQAQLASKAIAENLTVKALERLVTAGRDSSTHLPRAPKGSRGTHVAPPELQDMERRLREHLGTRVVVEEGLRKGRIVIEFYSIEDFERVIKIIGLE